MFCNSIGSKLFDPIPASPNKFWNLYSCGLIKRENQSSYIFLKYIYLQNVIYLKYIYIYTMLEKKTQFCWEFMKIFILIDIQN